jgi:hypothetical protein
MQSVAGVSRRARTVGAGFGLVAEAVGIGQWVVTQRDLAARWAAFQATYRYLPPVVYRDATNVVRGYEWFWLGTSFVPAAVLLAMSWLAAFTGGWAWQHQSDGKRAGFVAAAVGGGLYIAATFVAVWTSPAPDMTVSVTYCEPVWCIVLLVGVLVLAPGGASVGVRTRQARSRGPTAF